MAPDSTVTGSTGGQNEVMTAVDDGRLLIADVSRDDAWLAMQSTDAPRLKAYR
jgi:hypothetical protein